MTVIYARIERIRDTLLPKAKKATPSEQTLARLHRRAAPYELRECVSSEPLTATRHCDAGASHGAARL